MQLPTQRNQRRTFRTHSGSVCSCLQLPTPEIYAASPNPDGNSHKKHFANLCETICRCFTTLPFHTDRNYTETLQCTFLVGWCSFFVTYFCSLFFLESEQFSKYSTHQVILYQEGRKIHQNPRWDHEEHSVAPEDVQQPKMMNPGISQHLTRIIIEQQSGNRNSFRGQVS